MNFHCVPNQVLYQAEPRPDKVNSIDDRNRAGRRRFRLECGIPL